MAAMVIGMPALVAIVWMILRHRERMAKHDALPKTSAAGIEARLERLEDAIDGIAVEMERLGEGQRFTAKLLVERGTAVGEPIVARPPERASTPH